MSLNRRRDDARPSASRDEGADIHIVHVVCSDGFAGVERYISRIGPALAQRGAQVTVVGGDVRAMTRALDGSPVDFVPAADIGQARRALAKVTRPDIVNTHMSEADLVGALASRRSGARLVSTRHFAARRGSRAAVKPLSGWVGRRIDAQIAISRFVADAIEGTSAVVHTGVDDAEGAPPDSRQQAVLVAQRLEPEKDTGTAIRAWAATSARTTGWRLIVAGDGSERHELESLARGLGVADTVDFVGHREDVHDLMARAAVLLAPTPREGLGLSVLEAMARATPIIASASGGHLETAGAVDPSRLFEPRDVTGAARRMDDLIADAGARVALGEALQRHQRSEFSLPAQVEGTRAVYEAVMRG